MTRKEETLLQKILELFVSYDSDTIKTVVNILSSNDFDNYLKTRDTLIRLTDNVQKGSKENQVIKGSPNFEKIQAVKRIRRLLRTNKIKQQELEKIISSVLILDQNIDIASLPDIDYILQNQTVEKIMNLESALMKLYRQNNEKNSLENWSSIIVKDNPDNK